VQTATYVTIRAWPWSKPEPVEGSEYGRASSSEGAEEARFVSIKWQRAIMRFVLEQPSMGWILVGPGLYRLSAIRIVLEGRVRLVPVGNERGESSSFGACHARS
jgi:hypothetical protein